MLILKEPATTILLIFSIAFFGYIIGRIRICGISLITSAVFLVGLVFGHFGHVGPISLKLSPAVVNPLKEIGLIMFFAGAGAKGGKSLMQTAGTDDVVAAYATTYPIAMINMVIVVQLLAKIAG